MPKIIFIRHGHALSQNERDLVTGRCAEFPLSDKGHAQASSAASILKNYPVRRIYASPCRRTIETTEHIVQALNASYTVEDALTERSQGEFEMRPKKEAYTPETIKLIHADQFGWAPPGGEALKDVSNRLTTFLQSLDDLDEDGCYLCVTHLMLLWSVFYVATRCDHMVLPQLQVQNCGLVEVEFKAPDKFKLLRWNQALL